MTMLLESGTRAGAEAADAIVAGGVSEEVCIRFGKLESMERAEDRAIGLRVFVDGRNAVISTASTDKTSIDTLAARAVAMARIAPQAPYAGLAEASHTRHGIP